MFSLFDSPCCARKIEMKILEYYAGIAPCLFGLEMDSGLLMFGHGLQ